MSAPGAGELSRDETLGAIYIRRGMSAFVSRSPCSVMGVTFARLMQSSTALPKFHGSTNEPSSASED
jgi:hypothetical protein